MQHSMTAGVFRLGTGLLRDGRVRVRARVLLGVGICLLGPACSDYGFSPEKSGAVEPEDVREPAIEVWPGQVDFGLATDGSAERVEVVRIESVGEAELALTGVFLDDPAGPFAVGALAVATLAPGEATELLVSVGEVEGPAQTTLWIDSSDPDQSRVGVELVVGWEEGDATDGGETEAGCVCPEGFLPSTDDTVCERTVETPATPVGEGWEVCPIVPYVAYGKLGARYPGGTTVQDSYWGMNDSVPDGRLNTVGVWACDAPGVPTTGSNPVGEWIGFGVCVEVDGDGDYLLGIGGDNRTRFRVDGVEVFAQTDDVTRNFDYWHMNALSLSTGSHIIEIEGYNAGSIGAFGAELAGPFPTGSLVDDASMAAADYAGSVAWSTADAIGNAFPIGEEVGWECPDGSVFDACAEEPICVAEEETACLPGSGS